MKQHSLPEREWQMGKTKIFLRHCVREPLEDKRTALVYKSAVRIQKIYRGYVRRKGMFWLSDGRRSEGWEVALMIHQM